MNKLSPAPSIRTLQSAEQVDVGAIMRRRQPVVVRMHHRRVPDRAAQLLEERVRRVPLLRQVRVSDSHPFFLHYQPLHWSDQQLQRQAADALGLPVDSVPWERPYRLVDMPGNRFYDDDNIAADQPFKLFSHDVATLRDSPEVVASALQSSAIAEYLDRGPCSSGWDKTFWMASNGSISSTHYDAVDNFFVQLHGRKRFELYAPSQLLKLHLYPKAHPSSFKSQLPDELPPSHRRKWSAQPVQPAFIADLEPGDMLYVPPYWAHHVLSLGRSISLSFWRDAAECATVDEAEHVPLPFEPQEWPPLLMWTAAHAFIRRVVRGLQLDVRATAESLIQSRYAQLLASSHGQHRAAQPALCEQLDPLLLLTDAMIVKISDRANQVATHLSALRSPDVLLLKLHDYIETVFGAVHGASGGGGDGDDDRPSGQVLLAHLQCLG
eukprot:TRINITY_DN75801_c0_g1_i1.p1 TRINITY_DN75801_c0_g1~~TRINITY_DN75801_c0_g1_i1.p1  ORF type:complete len:467 (-),score=145.12 TRINITY_DN75801_c0_g1_i1:35-1345(-)